MRSAGQDDRAWRHALAGGERQDQLKPRKLAVPAFAVVQLHGNIPKPAAPLDGGACAAIPVALHAGFEPDGGRQEMAIAG